MYKRYQRLEITNINVVFATRKLKFELVDLRTGSANTLPFNLSIYIRDGPVLNFFGSGIGSSKIGSRYPLPSTLKDGP